ncbi:MAG: D-cysteine desulfhydrase [Comamonadaceae bacterium]|nr:D-cysteine desulfhydrase [Comamonadaceae bacterium]
MKALTDAYPRVRLGHLPTPLEPLPHLTEWLAGPRLYVKRDDCTGLATGGNKARKLEFLLADALAQGATVVVTVGALQSNHVRQTAAAAARLGLACVALLEDKVDIATAAYQQGGNVMLDALLGASVRRYPRGTDMAARLAAVCDELQGQGQRPYAVPMGGSSAIGNLGYVECARELAQQALDQGIPMTHIVLATGSGGTHVGLQAGVLALGLPVQVVGVNIMGEVGAQTAMVWRQLQATLAQLDVASPFGATDLTLVDGHVGSGYGLPTAGGMEAIRTVARLEALLLDPVYTGKAMGGLIDLTRRGHWSAGDHVVFLHTGGQAGLFAYAEHMAADAPQGRHPGQ